MKTAVRKELPKDQSEKNINEGLNLLQEIINDLARRSTANKFSSLMDEMQQKNIIKRNASDKYPSTDLNTVVKKKKIPLRYHNADSLRRLDDDDEINRHIANLRCSICRAKEENKAPLKAKLEILLELRAERIRNGLTSI